MHANTRSLHLLVLALLIAIAVTGIRAWKLGSGDSSEEARMASELGGEG